MPTVSVQALVVTFVCATRSPPAQPHVWRVRVGEQRAQWRFIAGSRIRKAPPRQREVDALRVKERQPVVDQRRVGLIIFRLVRS